MIAYNHPNQPQLSRNPRPNLQPATNNPSSKPQPQGPYLQEFNFNRNSSPTSIPILTPKNPNGMETYWKNIGKLLFFLFKFCLKTIR